MNELWHPLDQYTLVAFLTVPEMNLVKLQAIFESYEGIAMVRTLDMRRHLVSILTTPEMRPWCDALLTEIQAETEWRAAPPPPQPDFELVFGYSKKESHA